MSSLSFSPNVPALRRNKGLVIQLFTADDLTVAKRIIAIGDERSHGPSRLRKRGSPQMTQRRHRFKQELTLQDRLAAWSNEVLEQAAKLPPGPEKDALIKKARQATVACNLDDWASAPSLPPSH